MKLFLDLKNRRFVKSAASNVALDRLVLKRRDTLPIEVVYVENGATATPPAGTTAAVGLKAKFSDANFLSYAAPGQTTLDLFTQPVEAAFSSNPATVSALLEIRWGAPGTAHRTATLAVELQNAVILGTEATPAAIPDGKATQAEAEAGTDNAKWMTPLRTAQAILRLAATSWSSITGKPTEFPPSPHTHTIPEVTGLTTALAGKATAAQGTLADTALQPTPVNYRGEYNNGLDYTYDDIVTYTDGLLYIRVSNPNNPGYPPGHFSWALFSASTGSPAYDLWVSAELANKAAAVHTHTISEISDYAEPVVVYPTAADFPATGRLQRLYLADDLGTLWRWTGTTYQQAPGTIDAGEY